MTAGESLRDLVEAVEEYQPVAVYALFSGGHDSLAATKLAWHLRSFTAAVHINTGIGVEATREFVRETSRREGWPLIERHPPNKTYDQFVVEHGFPSGPGHRYAYSWLKERALRQLIRETKKREGDRVMLITGVRKQESKRRMGYVRPLREDGSRLWVAPIAEWSKRDVDEFIERHHLPRNPVVDILHMSGECLCGAMAERGELRWIAQWYPEVAQRIFDLQERVKAAGQPRCIWGQDKLIDPNQSSLDLCWSCESRLSA